MRPTNAARTLALTASVSLLAGCMSDLANGTVVDRPRVLGVRIEVEGDAVRAEPRPGERVTLRWLLVPGEDAWTSALTACVAAPANTGLPGCVSGPIALAPPGAPQPSPDFSFAVPDTLRGGETILVTGVLCASGTPALPAEAGALPTCEGEGATAEVVLFSFSVAGMAPPNHHPSWQGQAFTLDGMAWEPPPEMLPQTGCASVAGAASFPRVEQRGEDDPSVVTFTTSSTDRETYQALVLGEMPSFVARQEDLRITHAATAGQFARLFTEVFDDESPTPEVPWRHPAAEDVPEEGLTVRFWMVLRDPRGGMDWTERALCVVPAPADP